MGPSQISDAPLSISFKVISFWTLISVNCIGLGSQGHVLLRKCSSWYPWSGQGIRRSGRQVPVNMFVSLAAFTSLPCMFSLTLHLNFRHVDCLSAEFISPLLLFSEASLWQIIVVAEEERFHFPLTPMWTCTVSLASLLTLASHCCCFMTLLPDKVLQYQQTKFGKLWGEF